MKKMAVAVAAGVALFHPAAGQRTLKMIRQTLWTVHQGGRIPQAVREHKRITLLTRVVRVCRMIHWKI